MLFFENKNKLLSIKIVGFAANLPTHLQEENFTEMAQY